MSEFEKKDLAAVCCYYNPFGCPVRRSNFDDFRAKMSLTDVPLLIVEVATSDRPFELEASEFVMQRRCVDLMWYKAGGLNLGARHLIGMGYRNVAYMDADTYPLQREWKKPVVDALEKHPYVQVAGRVRCRGLWRETVSLELLRGQSICPGHDGAAWAARAELWTDFGGHFPYSVVGGDNRFLVGPLYPQCFARHPLRRALSASPGLSRELECYHRGLREFLGSAGLGCVALDFEELWHGSYWRRRAAFQPRYRFYSHFDPSRDLQENEDGLYEFRDPAQAREVARFMRLRELGRPWLWVILENLRKRPQAHLNIGYFLRERFPLTRSLWALLRRCRESWVLGGPRAPESKKSE